VTTLERPGAVPEENRLIAERRAKLAALRAQGPAYPNHFRRDALAADLLSTYQERDAAWLEANPVRVRVGGRMMFKRLMGKASFVKLADRSGAIQLFLQEETLGATYEAFKSYDVGDILGAVGPLFRTRTGELTVRVSGLQLLVKSLRPLPDKWHGLADTETRYRQRYVDLVMNEASRAVFRTRSAIVRYLRDALEALDFLEVETPMMQPIAGGALVLASVSVAISRGNFNSNENGRSRFFMVISVSESHKHIGMALKRHAMAAKHLVFQLWQRFHQMRLRLDPLLVLLDSFCT